MKKVFLVIATAMLLASLILTGCSNALPNSGQEGGNDFNYDLLLQMQKNYVGEADNVEYESLKQFINQVFSKALVPGALAAIECVDTVFYITVRHDGEDIMITGKAVSKCKVVAVAETFNNYNVKSNAMVELVQDYYVIPTNEKDTMEMFESFGANFIKDSTGATIGMEIKDGDYALQIKKGVDYTLKIRNDVLPMEPGIQYTGAIISHESINTVLYLSPVENTQRYEVFQMSESVMNIATEIKHNLYPEKRWEAPGPGVADGEDAGSVTEEMAISIARGEFEKIQQTGIGKDYVLRGVFNDTEEGVWIVYFSSEPLVPGDCYNIAISKNTGDVLNTWPGE